MIRTISPVLVRLPLASLLLFCNIVVVTHGRLARNGEEERKVAAGPGKSTTATARTLRKFILMALE